MIILKFKCIQNKISDKTGITTFSKGQYYFGSLSSRGNTYFYANNNHQSASIFTPERLKLFFIQRSSFRYGK